MKIRIDGRVLLVKQTTRSIIEWQRQSGFTLTKITKEEIEPYAPATAAFHALHNAGFNPSWDELLDRDITDFQLIKEKGDDRPAADAPDPSSSPADSGAESVGAATPAPLESKPSKKSKGGSKTK